MVRMLLKSLLSLSLIAPLSVFALGLGDVRLHSALGERLRADIELLSVNQAEAEDIRVSLASQDTFDKVGLERSAVLMFLSFEVARDPAGNYSIKVTSREPVNEPFLDFLVEVNWKSGRVLREYTLLLDPPSSYRESATVVSTPSTVTAATPPPSAAATVPSVRAETGAAMRAAPAGPQSAADGAAGGLVYGPVNANDTLWRIAEKMRPSSDITVQQMMLALLKANPYAFFDNNINRLKRGYVLRIDDPAILNALSRDEAAHEVARQTRAWQDYREGVAARAKQRSAVAAAVGSDPATVARSEPKLKLVTPEGKGVDSAAPNGSAGGKSPEQVSEELMLAMESAAAQRKDNEALKSRLEALEGQLQDMEKIITLKDADLAALQLQLREQGKVVDLPSEQQPVSEVEKAALVVGQDDAPQEQPVAGVTSERPVAGEEARPEPQQQVAKKPKPKPKVVAPPVEEPSLLADQVMLGVGGSVLLFILILLGLIIKRRRKGSFQESILSGDTSSMMKASDEQGSETSFLSDLAISGMGPGTMHSDDGEVDPLTEADVFMAYGRNQQAEEVLRKAREKMPERVDIAAKLLELYYNTKERAKFEALAEEAVGSLQDDDELWGKVLAMGHELCPENVLFASGEAASLPNATEAHAAADADAVLDIGLDLDEFTAEMEGEGIDGMDFDLGLDFSDLDDESDKKVKDVGEHEVAPELEESEPLAADFSDLDLEADLGELELAGEAEGAVEDAATLDFDLDLGAADELTAEDEVDKIHYAPAEEPTAEEPAAEEITAEEITAEEITAEEPVAATDDFELDLGDFDLAEMDSETAREAATESVGGPVLDITEDDLGELDGLGDLGDLGEMDGWGDLGEPDELGDLDELDGGEDEITTKLDLAQAYAEMGDTEGARSMLEEVIVAGSDEQKQQAQALIDKL
jgi:pilus assembly protein FimV